VEIIDNYILSEIKTSAGNIIENGGGSVLAETCRICKILRASNEFELFCPSCDD
jgi:hypothetical protein